jgi:hypothetical protein
MFIVSCVPRSMPTTISITIFTTQHKNTLIGTPHPNQRFTHMQNTRIQVPTKTSTNSLHNKNTTKHNKVTMCFKIQKTGFWSHTILTYPEHQKNWNPIHIGIGFKLTYPKLPIVTRIKICNYNKIPNNCCALQGQHLQLSLSPYSQHIT